MELDAEIQKIANNFDEGEVTHSIGFAIPDEEYYDEDEEEENDD